jgi:hypothetical protein
MTKQFLLYLNVCAVLVEQSRVRVSKRHANRVSQLRPFLPPAATSDVERSKGAMAFQYVYLRIPTRFLEESKGAFADILAKASLGRDQPA